ncbi:c-type cytochrome [Thermoflexibacter ruber]|nr:cytochrome c [Thermoflexibacter ruber]
MKNFSMTFLLGIAMSCILVACGGGEQTTEKQETAKTEEVKVEETKKEQTTPSDNTATATVADLPGKGIYTTYCSVCHQADGKGVPNMNPPLVNKEWVGGDKTRLIKVVLNGLNEPITVNGEKYQGVMASHDFLTDKQIANVLTFIRKSFGNDYEAITEEEVAEVRKNNKK